MGAGAVKMVRISGCCTRQARIINVRGRRESCVRARSQTTNAQGGSARLKAEKDNKEERREKEKKKDKKTESETVVLFFFIAHRHRAARHHGSRGSVLY